MEELAIEMSDVIKKMYHQGAKTFPGYNILLATHVAKPARYRSTTVQTVLFMAFRGVTHNKFLLKINTSMLIKKYQEVNLVY